MMSVKKYKFGFFIILCFLVLTGKTCALLDAPPEDLNKDGIADGVRDPSEVTIVTPSTPTGSIDENWITGPCAFSFAHTQPGIQSEGYLAIDLTVPAERATDEIIVRFQFDGPGVIGEHEQLLPYQNTPLKFIFPLNRFGTYTYTGTVMANGNEVDSCEGEGVVK
jgi:hypothetical protein